MGIAVTLNIEAKFKKASALLNEGNQLAAIQIYKKLLTKKEAERNATIKLADLYDQSGSTKSAIKLFNSYLRRNSKDEEVNCVGKCCCVFVSFIVTSSGAIFNY